MSERVPISLTWVGRAPPAVERYMAVGRFDALRDQWPASAWSVVVYAPPGGFVPTGFAEASMLVGEAPAELLAPGSRFDVMAGSHMVAHATVVGTIPTTTTKS